MSEVRRQGNFEFGISNFGFKIHLPANSKFAIRNPKSPRPLILRSPARELSSTFGPSLRTSRGDPVRRLTSWVPPCSRSVQRKSGTNRASVSHAVARRGAPPLPACRSGPAGADFWEEGCDVGGSMSEVRGPKNSKFAIRNPKSPRSKLSTLNCSRCPRRSGRCLDRHNSHMPYSSAWP
jgi:hypothetical protein